MSEPIHATTAQVRAGTSSPALLELAKRKAPDPSIFAERPPFFWAVEASNTTVDAYSTHMTVATLKNFAAEASAGVNFQNSHRVTEQGIGRSVQGRFIGPGSNGIARMEADIYTVPGLNLNGVNTDEWIAGIRAGLVADVSVGFYLGAEGRYVCDLCGNALMSRACSHYPGMLYPKDNKEGSPLVRATAAVDNAHLAEISAVYDGATPSCGVLKAYRAVEEGNLEPQLARQLEVQYRCRIPGSGQHWAGIDLPEPAVLPGYTWCPEQHEHGRLVPGRWIPNAAYRA